MLIAVLLAAAQPAPVSLDEIAVYDRLDWSRDITECDRLASHPDDPERVTDGVAQGDVDLEAARAACEAAVAGDPGNPRLNYQLARVNGYAGRHEEGQPFRDTALRAGYPQSLFVVGYIRLTGWDGRPDDACYGGELIRRSARAGRFAGLVGFPHYVVTGRFAGCPSDQPVIDHDEMTRFLDHAEADARGFYQEALVIQLRSRMVE
ncbi:MAG: hypothetical protein ACXIVL_03680 [Oceanicaulis sp.]